MTPSELLRERYKVIAPYPDSRFEIGDILHRYYFETSDNGMYTYVTNLESPLEGASIKKEYAETMPHLFKKLEWWERDYKIVEAVKYIKNTKTGNIYEVMRYGAQFGYMSGVRDQFTPTKPGNEMWPIDLKPYHLPATEAEYLEYINQKEG